MDHDASCDASDDPSPINADHIVRGLQHVDIKDHSEEAVPLDTWLRQRKRKWSVTGQTLTPSVLEGSNPTGWESEANEPVVGYWRCGRRS
jgi:hypothetical protein